jgi:hypothetical protein
MSIVNDKKSIVTEIGVLNSIGKTAELPDQNITFPSVNTKNEPIPFMLDLLTACIGSEALQRTTGQVMTNFIRKIEPDLKSNLKKQSVTYNSEKTLPAGFVSGYQLPTKKIDLFNKLKTDPSSAEGSLLYQDNVNSFDKTAYNAIVNANSDVSFGNIVMRYNDVTDKMTIKPSNPSDTIGSFVNTYIDNLKIIDEKEFTTQIMETMYGTLSNSTKKPKNSILEEEKIRNLIDKLIESDEFATISDDELEALERLAANKFKGVVPIDVGCSIIDSVLYLSDIEGLIQNNTGNTDPVNVGGAYDTVMENSFGRVPQQTNPANKNAIRDGYFKKLIKTITSAIVIALTSTPQIRVLLAMLNGFKNNDNVDFPSNSVDDINSQKNFVNCIGKSASALINEFIFNLLKTELLKIIIPVATLLVKEKLQAFIRVIQSLF